MASTRFSAAGIILSFWAACLMSSLAAQPSPELSRPRLISPSQGEAIVVAAWDLRRGLPAKPDCSHFVQAIYEKAGFNYEYATTVEIFEGIGSFERLQVPQAGDLVVWQGHMGIVVDPVEHSFYSSVNKGFAIEDYRSDYWISRGNPRFYRYLVQVDDARGATLQSRAGHMAGAAPPVDPEMASARATSVPQPPAATPVESQSRSLNADENEAETRDVVFVSVRDKPAKNQVLAALVGTIDGRAAGIAQSIHLETAPQVVIADDFSITGIKIKKNSGWAEVEVRQRAAFRFGSADPTPVTNSWRLTLSRQEQVWVLFVPRGIIFLRHDYAKLALSRHLAALPRANKREREKVQQILDNLQSPKETAELESVSH